MGEKGWSLLGWCWVVVGGGGGVNGIEGSKKSEREGQAGAELVKRPRSEGREGGRRQGWQGRLEEGKDREKDFIL